MLSGSKSYGKEELILISKTDANKGSKSEKNYSFSQKDLSWKKEIDEFADSIINDHKIKNGTLEESMKVMKLIEEIYSKDTDWYNNYVK